MGLNTTSSTNPTLGRTGPSIKHSSEAPRNERHPVGANINRLVRREHTHHDPASAVQNCWATPSIIHDSIA